MSVTRNVWLPALILTIAIYGHAIRCAAMELPADQAAVLQEVIESVRKNDSAIKSFHALEVVHMGPIDDLIQLGSPNADSDPPVEKQNPDEDEETKPDPDVAFGATITFPPEGGVTLRYDIWFDGLNERSKEETSGILFMWHNGTTTTHWPESKQADIYRSKSKSVLQSEDPRFIGFIRSEGGLVNVLTGNSDGLKGGNVEVKHQIRSVRRAERDGHKLVVIEAKNPNEEVTTVIECDSTYNYLPTRVYYRRDDGNIDCKTDMEYSQVENDPRPVWFLHSAVQQFASSHNIKSPDADEWGQTVTMKIKELEVNPEIPKDLFDLPELPDGTIVSDGIKDVTYKVGEQQED